MDISDMLVPIMILVSTGVAVLAIFGSLRYRKNQMTKLNSTLEMLGQEMGWKIRPGIVRFFKNEDPQLIGRIQNFNADFDFFSESRQSGNSRVTYYYARLSVNVPNARNLAFEITPQSILAGVGAMIGIEDPKTGDKKFDDTFWLGGKSAKVLPLLIGERERQLFLNLKDAAYRGNFRVKLNNGFLTITNQRNGMGYVDTVAVKATMQLATQLVNRLDSHAWTDSGVETFWDSSSEGQQVKE